MSDLQITPRFPIDPRTVSTRLIFAKTSILETVWHVLDSALGKAMPDGKVIFMALHGDWIYPEVRCDTVLQTDLRYGLNDSFCQRCILEMELARAEIQKRDLLK